MHRDMLTLGLGLGVILLATQGLRAQDAGCADRALIVERLVRDYGESRQAAGLVGERQVVELFASPETGTWTILVTTASGIACLVAAGEHFQRIDPVPAGDPA